MLTGTVPFEAGGALGGVVARLREKAPDVRAARPGAPAWLAAERRASSDSQPLLLSLSSEIEARRGNVAVALGNASRAFRECEAARARHPWARAHAALLADRLAKLAERAGRKDLVREARRK